MSRHSTKTGTPMASMHMKIFSTSLIINSKPQISYHYTPTRTANIKKTGHTKCWWGCETTWTITNCWEKYIMVQSCRETGGSFWKIFKCYTVLVWHPRLSYTFSCPWVQWNVNSIWKMGWGWNTHTHTHFIPGHLLKRNKSICTHKAL